MPELPEVEVVRRGLDSALTCRTIAAILAGRTFATPRRRGKYLWLPFTDGDAILAHLGMSGQFLDPFDPAFSPVGVADRIRRKRTGLKRALLNQTVVSGIGKIHRSKRTPLCGTVSTDRACA